MLDIKSGCESNHALFNTYTKMSCISCQTLCCTLIQYSLIKHIPNSQSFPREISAEKTKDNDHKYIKGNVMTSPNNLVDGKADHPQGQRLEIDFHHYVIVHPVIFP